MEYSFSWNSFIGTKVLGTFAPEERKFHRSECSMERKFHGSESSTGAKVLSVDFSLPGTKVLRNEKAWNHVTDRQTDRFAISISRVSMLTRDKNYQHISASSEFDDSVRC